MVDAIRRADRTHQLGEVASHWLAIAAMSTTARLLSNLLRGTAWVASWNELVERIAALRRELEELASILQVRP